MTAPTPTPEERARQLIDSELLLTTGGLNYLDAREVIVTRVAQAIAAAVREQRERDCAAVCERCADLEHFTLAQPTPATENGQPVWHYHEAVHYVGQMFHCKASAIRAGSEST